MPIDVLFRVVLAIWALAIWTVLSILAWSDDEGMIQLFAELPPMDILPLIAVLAFWPPLPLSHLVANCFP